MHAKLLIFFTDCIIAALPCYYIVLIIIPFNGRVIIHYLWQHNSFGLRTGNNYVKKLEGEKYYSSTFQSSNFQIVFLGIPQGYHGMGDVKKKKKKERNWPK